MADYEVDVLIVGGGIIGATLQLTLINAGINCLLVDANVPTDRTQEHFDARTIALSPASVRIFQTLNLWSALASQANPIKTIHVSEQGCFGSVRLVDPVDQPLGYVIEMQYLNQTLAKYLNHQHVLAPAKCIALDQEQTIATIQCAEGGINTIQAKLIVAADGTESKLRHLCNIDAETKTYHQTALVANVGLARSHQHIAYERFTILGPLALLPMTNQRSALIWSLPTSEAERYLSMSDLNFLKQLQTIFGYRLGRFFKLGQRSAYALRQVTLNKLISDSVVFIGNAAHTLHPVAAQGLNLGLRDAAMLAQHIIHTGCKPDSLHAYQRDRQADQQTILKLTDNLVELFDLKIPGMSAARSVGLLAFDQIPILKKILLHYASGFGGVIPDLVCNIPLNPPGEYYAGT